MLHAVHVKPSPPPSLATSASLTASPSAPPPSRQPFQLDGEAAVSRDGTSMLLLLGLLLILLLLPCATASGRFELLCSGDTSYPGRLGLQNALPAAFEGLSAPCTAHGLGIAHARQLFAALVALRPSWWPHEAGSARTRRRRDRRGARPLAQHELELEVEADDGEEDAQEAAVKAEDLAAEAEEAEAEEAAAGTVVEAKLQAAAPPPAQEPIMVTLTEEPRGDNAAGAVHNGAVDSAASDGEDAESIVAI